MCNYRYFKINFIYFIYLNKPSNKFDITAGLKIMVRNKMELFQSSILFLSTQQLADRLGDQQAVER